MNFIVDKHYKLNLGSKEMDFNAADEQFYFNAAAQPSQLFNDTQFTPPPYEPPANIVRQHHWPRFGMSNNFETFVQGVTRQDDDAAKDYMVGVFAGSLLILGLALIWFMIIISLKIAGQKRVGFLAGRLEHPYAEVRENEGRDAGTLPVIEEEPEDFSDYLDENNIQTPIAVSNEIQIDTEFEKADKKFKRKVLFVRIMFVLSGLAVIICGILFYVEGIRKFEESITSTRRGLELTESTLQNTVDFTDTILTEKDELVNELRNTMNDTAGFICNGDGTIPTQIRQFATTVETQVEHLSKALNDQLGMFSSDVREVLAITQDVDEKIQVAYRYLYATISVSVVILILIFSMLAVTAFSMKGVSNYCTIVITHAILWPVFVFFLLLAWIFATLFLVLSLAGSDFCMQPDVFTASLLVEYQDKFHSMMFEFLMYYVSGCATVPYAAEGQLNDIGETVFSVLNSVSHVVHILSNQTLATIENECGLNQAAASALQGGLELIKETSNAVSATLNGLVGILGCKNMNPIYTTFMHDALCIDGVSGLTALFSTTMFLSFFAMLMITFRAALYPVMQPPQPGSNQGMRQSLLK